MGDLFEAKDVLIFVRLFPPMITIFEAWSIAATSLQECDTMSTVVSLHVGIVR
jgi:hypothetical protein